ncbi:MAG: hypothetical protein ACPLN1_03990 [Caldisericia bacterium]
MKRFFNGLTLSIIFGVIFTLLRKNIDTFLYIPGMESLFPIIFLSYILILVMIGIYLKNPISGIICGIVSLFSKYLTEITILKFNGTPVITLTDKLYPNLDFENLNILLSTIIFSILSFFYSKFISGKKEKINNPLISLVLLISLFLGFFLNYYYVEDSIYILPLTSLILGLISFNLILSFTSAIFFGISYSFFYQFIIKFKGDLNLMFNEPYHLIPDTLIILIFTIVLIVLSSYIFYTIFSILKGRRISVKVKEEKEKGVKEETPALQEEQSQKTEGGNDEKVRDDGNLQTKSQ